jgi:hypothetical protein
VLVFFMRTKKLCCVFLHIRGRYWEGGGILALQISISVQHASGKRRQAGYSLHCIFESCGRGPLSDCYILSSSHCSRVRERADFLGPCHNDRCRILAPSLPWQNHHTPKFLVLCAVFFPRSTSSPVIMTSRRGSDSSFPKQARHYDGIRP